MTRAELAGLIERARLSGAKPDAHGANLVRADLSGMDLRGVDFTGSDLRSANLSGCLGQGANFRGADLSCCSLIGSRLDDVDFRLADLTGADFTCAVLEGADIGRAHVQRVRVEGAWLSRCKREVGATKSWTGWKNAPFRGGPTDLPVIRMAQLEMALG